MPTYEVTAPDGQILEVTAPDGATEDEVLAYAQANWKPSPTKPSAPKDNPPASLSQPSAQPNDIIGTAPDDGWQPYDAEAEKAGYEILPDGRIRVSITPAAKHTSSAATPPQDDNGPGFVSRQLGAFNEGLADTLGAPVDIVNAGLGAVGLPMSDKPLLGSESIRDGMRSLGIGQLDERFAPQSAIEKYTQAGSRGIGQAIVPGMGLPVAGGSRALQAYQAASKALPAASPTLTQAAGRGLRTMALEAAKRPGVAVGSELAAGAGAGIGGQAGRDIDHDNPATEIVGSLAGGLAGGLSVGTRLAKGNATQRLATAQASNPDIAYDARIATDLEKLVSSLPSTDIDGRKLSRAARDATIRSRVQGYVSSLTPNVRDIESLDGISPASKASLRSVLKTGAPLTPDELDALSVTDAGRDIANALRLRQRALALIPELSVAAPNDPSIGGTITEAAAITAAGKVGGPLASGAARIGSRILSENMGKGDSGAAAVRALAGRAKTLRDLRAARGLSDIGDPVSAIRQRAATVSEMADQAKRKAKADKALAKAETKKLTADNRRVGIANDRQNVRPGGGFRGSIYDKTGLLPAAQDQGALEMLNAGVITPAQFEAFLTRPDALQSGNAGNAIIDRLAQWADEGVLPRDPQWQPAAPASSPSSPVIRNPEAYKATAKGNQDRVSRAIDTTRQSYLTENAKEAIATAAATIGNTSTKADAERIVTETLESLTPDARQTARTILNPLVAQIKN